MLALNRTENFSLKNLVTVLNFLFSEILYKLKGKVYMQSEAFP